MENNDYYEPKIKTSRKSLIHDELGIKIGEEVITSYKICTDDCISKTKLISFLKDRIKECERYLKTFEGKEQGDYPVYYYYAERDRKAYQEILYFVNEGDE